MIGLYPEPKDGKTTDGKTTDGAAVPAPTHYQVLLSSGKTGWIAASAARPLTADRLCYAKTREGRWTIVNLDQGEDD